MTKKIIRKAILLSKISDNIVFFDQTLCFNSKIGIIGYLFCWFSKHKIGTVILNFGKK